MTRFPRALLRKPSKKNLSCSRKSNRGVYSGVPSFSAKLGNTNGFAFKFDWLFSGVDSVHVFASGGDSGKIFLLVVDPVSFLEVEVDIATFFFKFTVHRHDLKERSFFCRLCDWCLEKNDCIFNLRVYILWGVLCLFLFDSFHAAFY